MEETEKRVDKREKTQDAKRRIWRKPVVKKADINRQTKTFYFDPDLTS